MDWMISRAGELRVMRFVFHVVRLVALENEASGSLHEDGGDFSMPAQWRIAQVAQDMPETDESPPTSCWAATRA